MNENDYKPQEQAAIEGGAKTVVKMAAKKLWAVVGKYILIALGIYFLIVLLIVLVFYMPTLSLRHAAKSITGESSAPPTVNGTWGNPFGDQTYESLGGRISSSFGPRTAPTQGASTWHKGIDIAIGEGTPVYAAADGIVVTAGEVSGGGKCVSIQTEDGYTFSYMHLSEIAVSVGLNVTVGTYLGKTGNTGTSTGPHLHYQIEAPDGVGTKANNGKWYVDPINYINGNMDPPADDGSQPGTPADLPNTSNYEQYWFNAQNVKSQLDTLFTTISDYNNGMTYITKDNFNMILDRVIDYANSVRRVTNVFTFYHHRYNKAVGYAYSSEKMDSEMDEDVSAQGEGEEEGVNQVDRVEYEYVGDDGLTYEVHYVWNVTDRERKDEIGHIINESPENDPIFKVSWEEIFTTAAMKSVVQNAHDVNWETEAEVTEVERPTIDGISRLDEETVKQLIEAFEFDIAYYFDPTSGDTMPNSSETYAEHTYSYDEMEDYAYIKSEEGVNVEHGEEEWETPNFDYYEYKKPAIAPAYATNAYTTIEYDYTDNPDGTATLAGRQVIVDGQKFYDNLTNILGEEVPLEWFVEFLSMLPGSNYDAGNGTLADRFSQILTSYQTGEPYSYYDSEFIGVGQTTLGTGCDRTPTVTTRRDEQGNPTNTVPSISLDLSVSDIDDAQIQQDINNGLYTLEDLVFLAACLQAEAGTVDGQVAVGWCIRNRVEKTYGSYKAAVTAPGQFSSPWARYLDGSFSAQARSIAAAVLKGQVQNPIGDAYFFFSASSCWGHKPGVWYLNVGGNMFYKTWGDVTQVVGKAGYVPF